MAFQGRGSFNAPQDGGRGESWSVAGVSTTLHCSADATLMIDTKARDKSLCRTQTQQGSHTEKGRRGWEEKKKAACFIFNIQKKKCSRTQEAVSFGLLSLITIVSTLAQKNQAARTQRPPHSRYGSVGSRTKAGSTKRIKQLNWWWKRLSLTLRVAFRSFSVTRGNKPSLPPLSNYVCKTQLRCFFFKASGPRLQQVPGLVSATDATLNVKK